MSWILVALSAVVGSAAVLLASRVTPPSPSLVHGGVAGPGSADHDGPSSLTRSEGVVRGHDEADDGHGSIPETGWRLAKDELLDQMAELRTLVGQRDSARDSALEDLASAVRAIIRTADVQSGSDPETGGRLDRIQEQNEQVLEKLALLALRADDGLLRRPLLAEPDAAYVDFETQLKLIEAGQRDPLPLKFMLDANIYAKIMEDIRSSTRSLSVTVSDRIYTDLKLPNQMQAGKFINKLSTQVVGGKIRSSSGGSYRSSAHAIKRPRRSSPASVDEGQSPTTAE